MKKFSIFITILILTFAACTSPNNNTINKIETKKVSGNGYSDSVTGSGTKVLGLPLNTGVEILEDGTYKVEAFYVDDETKKATGDINVRNKIELNKDKSEINLQNNQIKFSVIAPNV